MFGCQNKTRCVATLWSFLFQQPPIKRIIFIAQYHFFSVVFRAPGWSLQFCFLPRTPPINFTSCRGNSPFKASYCNVSNPELLIALEEGPHACVWRPSLQNRGEQLMESPCKQQLRLPHLPRRLSPRTQRGFPLPSCWGFVLAMLSLHLCLPHVPWRSSTCTSRVCSGWE